MAAQYSDHCPHAAAVPKDVLFKIFSGLTSGLSEAQVQPFIHNMHTALLVLALVSLAGAVVSLMRPSENRPQAVPAKAPS